MQDGSPAGPVIPGALAVYDFFSTSSNPTNCIRDHGNLVELVAERRGGALLAIDLGTDVQTSTARVEHTDIARNVVGLLESDYVRFGPRRVFNSSLQGADIGAGDKTGCST